jgi:hypothetical protein
MTELERLLVACLEHDQGKKGLRVNPDALGVVADWAEEHATPAQAEHVGLAVKSGLEGILADDGLACIAEGHSGHDRLMLSLTRKGRGRRRFVRLALWEYDPDAGTKADLWEGGAPFAADTDEQHAALTPSVRMARWHAVVHLLGYSPLMLLACCATEAAAA